MSLSAVALTKNGFAYDELRRRILTGELRQGSSLIQTELAIEIGVSTTPLREALRRLAAEGLVELSSHRDARVAPLTSEEARHLYTVRENLDPLAAGLAAENRTPEDISYIKRTLELLEPLHVGLDLNALTVHRDFHRAVYTATHNPVLIGILEGLWDKADRYRQITLQGQNDSDEDHERVRSEHEEIAQSIIDGDSLRAQVAMLRHIVGSLGRRAITLLDKSTHG